MSRGRVATAITALTMPRPTRHCWPGRCPGGPCACSGCATRSICGRPYGPTMVGKAKAAIDAAGKVTVWEYEVWSNTHTTRPGPAANLLPARLVDPPFAAPPRPIPMPEGGGDRNTIPIYNFPKTRVTYHFVSAM